MRPAGWPPHVATFPAPAKLNLDLRITGRRSDGYHNLETVFCLIDLYDTVGLAVRRDGQIRLHTPTQGVPPEQDLVCRAAASLKQVSGVTVGVDIWLHKNIPMGGGLGGGSSDAATVLMALNRLWGCHFSREQLMEVGLKLGADVPFFIFGRSAFAKGVGEQLCDMEIPEQWYVVVKPDVHVNTAAIFSHQDLTRDSKPSIMPTFLSLQPFRNDMQAVVLKEFPQVAQAFKVLSQYGQARMTGSGACVFLTFPEKSQAEAICHQIAEIYQSYCVAGLSQHPLLNI